MAMTNKASRRRSWTKPVLVALAVIMLAGIALDTKVVRIGSSEDSRQKVFDPDKFGQDEFPRIRTEAEERAAEADQLVTEIIEDKDAAIERYGTMTGIGAVMPVKFTGVVGEGRSGIFNVSVDGMPEGYRIRVQSGPAINGTDLRDLPGDIAFGQFKNQIEYQDAGSGINRAMSAEVLSDLDRDTLVGKTVSVTGVFKLINPKNWLVTPVRFEVQ